MFRTKDDPFQLSAIFHSQEISTEPLQYYKVFATIYIYLETKFARSIDYLSKRRGYQSLQYYRKFSLARQR